MTKTEHLSLARQQGQLASEAYDQAETIRDRATAWKWRRTAEQLTESATRHLTLAGAMT